MKPMPGFVKVIQKIDNFFNAVSKTCFALAALVIIGVTLLIFASVINRTFIGQVWLFVEDYATLALIPITYLVFGYVFVYRFVSWCRRHGAYHAYLASVVVALPHTYGIFLFAFVG